MLTILEFFDEAVEYAKRKQTGLCDGLTHTYDRYLNRDYTRDYHGRIEKLMWKWAKNHGTSYAYPVRGRYSWHVKTWRMWSRWHPYGRSRLKMVAWIREQLKSSP